MFRLALLIVLVLGLYSATEAKPRRKKGPKGGSRERDTDVDELRNQLSALEDRFEKFMSAGTAHAATSHDTCPSEKVHLHFHGGEQVDHGSPDDTYVHIKFDIDDHHDHYEHDDDDHEAEQFSGHCKMQSADGSSSINGFLHLTQFENARAATILIDMKDFPEANTEHGIHIHRNGDLSEGCTSLGPHYDPFDPDVDVGDLGTVITDDDKTVTHLFDSVRLSLFGDHSIIGRSAIIHDKDGAPLACCLIGHGKENPDHDHHYHHHDHHSHDVDDAGHKHGHGHHNGHKKHM